MVLPGYVCSVPAGESELIFSAQASLGRNALPVADLEVRKDGILVRDAGHDILLRRIGDFYE
jgi:hypothetical protein